MKKWLIGLMLIGMIAGCSEEEEPKEKQEPVDQADVIKPKTEELVATGFKNVLFTKTNEEVIVKGEAKAENDTFYYRVESQKGKVFIPEQNEKLAHPHAYLPFELKIDRNQLKKEDVFILVLYGKNAEEKPVNTNYIPFELQDIAEAK